MNTKETIKAFNTVHDKTFGTFHQTILENGLILNSPHDRSKKFEVGETVLFQSGRNVTPNQIFKIRK